jgi:predicted amidohydrolase YtcJ
MASRLTTFIVVLIVAGTLIAGLIVGAQRDDMDGPVDLIITNGRVYTGSGTSFAEAVAVRGNKILRVGTNRAIKRLRRRQTLALDAHGATVLPGFNDAHVGLVEAGLLFGGPDLSGATTPEEIASRLAMFLERHPDRRWVIGRGWSRSEYTGPLTRQALDAIVPDRPAYLIADDESRGWANTRALRAADIGRRAPAPAAIDRDSRTGEPTGQLRGAAHAMMLRALPVPSPAEQQGAVRAAIREAHRLGITSVHDFGDTPDRLSTFDTLLESGELPLRIVAALPLAHSATDADVAALDATRRRYPDDPVFKAGPISIDANRALGAEQAGRAERDSVQSAAAGELHRLVSLLDRRGWQIALHAGGESAVRVSLDALERGAAENRANDDRRHRIEGIDALDGADASRFAAGHVIASLQPAAGAETFAVDGLFEAPRDTPGSARDWPLHRLEESHARVVFGSNWPELPVDPRFGLDAAIAHAAAAGDATVDERRAAAVLARALDAYTANPAWASADEQRKGTLAPDMLADIVILSADIFAPGARILDAVVDTTIFDGRIVYSRSPAALTD